MAAAMSTASLSARSAICGTHLRPSVSRQDARNVSFFVEAGDESRRERCRKRHQRIRNRVKGTAERPRLAVYRSNNHIYCQVIDDVAQRTLAAANTLQATIKEKIEHGGNIDAAVAVGAAVAEACKGANVTKVVFDRGGNLYHGRVKALADAAREGGLEF